MWLKNFSLPGTNPSLAKKIWSVAIAVVVITTLIAAVPTRAATVTSTNDALTTLESGIAANHFLVFTTPSGINEGENITISFASSFNTVSITEDDIDFEDDGIDLTTAADCSGTEKASVAMIADVLTITICSGDGGAVALGSEITVEIGSNATASGTGANQITNPALEGTYYISIAGTFGDSGSIALPINGDDEIVVTATVSAGGGGGSPPPSGGGECGDSVEPTISDIMVLSVATNSASIYWKTNESASGFVDYGLSETYEIGIVADASFVTSRSVLLTDLAEGKEYHFRVHSTDVCGNTAESTDYTFTTLDETAPIISYLEVIDITKTSVRVIWETNEEADGQIDYGLTDGYGETTESDVLETKHSITLLGLSEGTTYHFWVTSIDASENSATSSDQTFSTSTDEAPGNVSSFLALAGDEQNVLTWVLPDVSDLAGVLILACLDDYPSSYLDSRCEKIFEGLDSSFIHTGLTNDTAYFYGAFAYDLAGQFASGALASATPTEIPEEGEEPPAIPGEEPTAIPEAEGEPEETAGTGETSETEGTGGSEDFCGDRICGSTESAFVCPDDCLVEEPEAPETSGEEETCGNAICDPEETKGSCPSDCPIIEVPPTTVSEGELVPPTDVSFITKNGSFKLEPKTNGAIDILAGSEIFVLVFGEHLNKTLEKIIFVLGSETYLLAKNDQIYSAAVTVSDTPARYTMSIIISYQDGTDQTLSFIGNLLNPGLVYEKADDQKNPISEAQITLLVQQNDNWIVWDGSPWNQFNPITTETDGLFSWYVENGNYQIKISKDGYDDQRSGVLQINNHIVTKQLEIKKIIQPTTITETALTIVATANETIAKITETVEMARESPAVQTSAEIAIPAAAVAAVATTTILVTTFDLLPFLQLFFTSPILLFKRRKRKAYGVVYHAFTKTPIDLAVVRLYRLPDNKLVGSRVTDKAGRYFFNVSPGNYRLEVAKQQFSFPAQSLSQIKDDAIYLDVYHGEPIGVTEKNIAITPNIPIEPKDSQGINTPKQIKKIQRLRKIQKWLAISGITLSAYVFLIKLSTPTALILTGQIIVYLLVRRLAMPPKPKSWGIVYNQKTNHPLSNVIVRIFEPKYHKLLETNLTDSRGRYNFLLGPNQYTSTFEKSGFHPAEISPIDYQKNSDIKEWAQDIKLSPKTPEN